MNPAEILGAAMLGSLALYALLAGADFGGGIWDLLASGPRAREQRAIVERAIGPIWEANHVWLVLVVVVLFAGFPAAFAAISTRLFVPLTLLLAGIVLRGAAFTFRTYDTQRDGVQRRWGLLFSGSSVLAPLMLGVSVGRIASGSREAFSLFSLLTGLFAAALFAFLAAVYLAVEAEGPLREDFRRRAIAAGAVVFALAAATAAASAREAPLVFRGLTARGFSLPLHVATGSAAVIAFAALYRRRFRLARGAAAAQVALVVAGWGGSQYPWLLAGDLTLESASAPRNVQVLLAWALGAGAAVLFPCLYLLFRVFKGERPFSIVDRR